MFTSCHRVALLPLENVRSGHVEESFESAVMMIPVDTTSKTQNVYAYLIMYIPPPPNGCPTWTTLHYIQDLQTGHPDRMVRVYKKNRDHAAHGFHGGPANDRDEVTWGDCQLGPKSEKEVDQEEGDAAAESNTPKVARDGQT